MYVGTDVLVVVLIGVLLLVGALLVQVRAEGRLKAQLRDKDRPIRPVMLAVSGIPEPDPHEHVWSKKPTAERGGWRMYACTVPGCTAEPLCKTGRD